MGEYQCMKMLAKANGNVVICKVKCIIIMIFCIKYTCGYSNIDVHRKTVSFSLFPLK